MCTFYYFPEPGIAFILFKLPFALTHEGNNTRTKIWFPSSEVSEQCSFASLLGFPVETEFASELVCAGRGAHFTTGRKQSAMGKGRGPMVRSWNVLSFNYVSVVTGLETFDAFKL